ARALIDGAHPPRPLRGTPPERLDEAEALLEDLLSALEPLRRSAGPLPDWVAAHDEAVTALTETEAGATGLIGPDGHSLLDLFEALGDAADPAIGLDGLGYAALFDQIAAEVSVRGPERSHPRLKILGLIEARLLSADRILLGGLDEAVWPPQVRTNAFLNRPMRATLGLTPPERRIGQAAHDFTIAMGQPEVIISRAAKRGGAPTVPSRFLQRLAALTGDAWQPCRDRGRRYLGLARLLDRPTRAVTLPRPCPKPPVALRPTRLSVTRVETLRRDPYGVYADRILRLQPLEPIGAPLGPRQWGTLFHDVIAAFTTAHPLGPLPDGAEAEILGRIETAFAPLMADAAFRAFMVPRLAGWARGFVAWERERRAGLAAIAVEAKGEWSLTLRDGSAFALTAHADRLETSRDGAVSIIDFKTGRVPSRREVQVGFAPQLTLEAALARMGGFAALGPEAAVGDALYVGFGSDATLNVTRLEWKDRSLPEVVDEHLSGLVALLSDFRRPEMGYLARPYPQFEARHSDYDHLSRVKEWSANGGDGSDA
ncbi:PD-(D/E)XK nuclease family protein, partial [Lichenihabitans sp. Uapishka_5]|uniref:PD-(D/E)XK nuclease family protein n=1 Tax=Lichenihabitans sp. Uapishka_5 TaxID=3037302 RepID=UPI0029E8232D